MSALVSVVIPCHNHAHYLRRAVDSVLTQTYRDAEVVIVNDGSTDDTHDVAAGLVDESPDRDIVVLDLERQGAPLAMNSGAAQAAGEYLLFLGADDTIEPEMLAKTVAEMESDPKCGIVYTYTTHRIDPDNPPKDISAEEAVQEYPEYDFAQWVRRNPELDACSLMRREAFEDAGGLDPNQFAEDLDLWLGITKRGWSAKLVPEPLFNYWHHGGARESDESWMQPIHLRWQLVHKHPELYDEAERLFVTSLMLASIAADVSDMTETVVESAHTGLDWITIEGQAERLDEQFSDLLDQCDAVADARVSAALGQTIRQLLSGCRRAQVTLSELARAAREHQFDAAVGSAEKLQSMLPRIGDETVLVFTSGMGEIYGPNRDGTGRTH